MQNADDHPAADELVRLRQQVADLRAEREAALARFEQLAQCTDDGLLLVEQGRVTYANDRACELLGRSRDDLRGATLAQAVGPEGSARVAEALAETPPDGPAETSIEVALTMGTETPRHLRVRMGRPPSTDRAASHVVTIRDLTEQHSAREALEQSEHFLEDIFGCILDGISVLDTDFRIVRTNATMERWYAHAMPLVGRRCFEAYHGRHEVCTLCPTHRTYQTERAAMETVPKRDVHGATVGWIDLHTFPLWDRRTGKLAGAIEYVRDVSEKKRAEAERDRLFAYSVDMLCVLGFDGFFKQVNPAAEKTLGWPEEAITAEPWTKLVHPDDAAQTATFVTELCTTSSVRSCLNRMRCRDGSYRLISWNAFPQPLDQLVYCVGRDVTTRRQLEEQLRQAHKMEAVGRLAAGVAHDFNNLLTPIIGYADLALMSIGPGDRWHEELHHILAAANHAQELTSQLLAFGRKQVLQVRSVDLSSAVEDTVPLLRRLLPESIDLRLDLDPTTGAVRADPGQLAQIVINLAINASESMPDGGRLTIATTTARLDEHPRAGQLALDPGHYCVLEVTDTGSGMDARTAERVFEPFFTTKDRATGAGLGLAVVHGIVEQHGGHVWLDSAPGRGSRFEVFLPRALRPPSARPSAPRPSAPRGLGETVLLVEDSPAVRRLAVMALEHVGYHVLAAASAEDALQLVDVADQRIDLLLTDVVLPGLNGRRLYERLAESRPDLRVLYMSGYTDDVIARHGILDEGTLLLQKPFSLADLVRMVQRALAAPEIDAEAAGG